MRVTTYAAAATFLARTEEVFRTAEAETGLIYGLARAVAVKADAYGSGPPLLVTVEDDGEDSPSELLVAALRTPPYNLVIHATHLPAEDGRIAPALRLLAQHLYAAGVTLPGANGRREITPLFAEAWAEYSGAAPEIIRRMRVFQLTEVIWPQSPDGRLRAATAADHAQVTEWLRDFFAEAMAEDVDATARPAAARVQQGIDEGTIYVWAREDGALASFVSGTRSTPRGRTINNVYTPPAQRGKGYASAAVAAFSAKLLADGYDFCTLFTDLSNPTSNHIYQAIGYRPVCDFTEMRFVV